jgi:hypothetical protein
LYGARRSAKSGLAADDGGARFPQHRRDDPDSSSAMTGCLTPVVRSFIAIPAVGWGLGAAWTGFDHAFRFIELGSVVVLALAVVAARRRWARAS